MHWLLINKSDAITHCLFTTSSSCKLCLPGLRWKYQNRTGKEQWDANYDVHTLTNCSMDLKSPGAYPNDVTNNSFGYMYFVEFQQQDRIYWKSRLIWRCVYRASYCNVLMTNEMHNYYSQFLFHSFLSALHVSHVSSRSSSGGRHNILYYPVQSVQLCSYKLDQATISVFILRFIAQKVCTVLC